MLIYILYLRKLIENNVTVFKVLQNCEGVLETINNVNIVDC